MSNLTLFKLNNPGLARDGAPLPERLIEGHPRFSNWDVEKSPDGKVRTGIWETTPGAYRCIKGGAFEVCYILSGVSDLVEDGQPAVRVHAGDAFVMKPDFVGIWRCIETTRKVWVVYGSA